MGWQQNRAQRIVEFEGLVCYAKTDKAMLIGIPDRDNDADPPQAAWFPLSQVWGEHEVTGHTAQLESNDRIYDVLKIKLKEWIVGIKYKDGCSDDANIRKGGLEDHLFDDYIIGEGDETEDDLYESRRR